MRNSLLHRRVISLFTMIFIVTFSLTAHAGGRLLATGGVTEIEGTAGSGIVPWSIIAGYGTEDELGVTAYSTWINLKDYKLHTYGVAVGIFNRVELSVARQRFDLDSLGNALSLADPYIDQDIYGAKVRLSGDLIYSSWPQISVGMHYKRNQDFLVPGIAGALKDSGIDYYVSASKLWLDGIAGYNLLVTANARASKANQLGLIGFGGDKNDKYKVLFETSVAVLLSRKFAIGVDYRQKPDNLSFAREDDWYDVYAAWFPNKHIAIVGAYVRLGSIGGFKQQDGWYLSLQGSY